MKSAAADKSALSAEITTLKTTVKEFQDEIQRLRADGNTASQQLEQQLADAERARDLAETEGARVRREAEALTGQLNLSKRQRQEDEETARRVLQQTIADWEKRLAREREDAERQANLHASTANSTADELARAQEEAARRQRELQEHLDALAAAERRHEEELKRLRAQTAAELKETVDRLEEANRQAQAEAEARLEHERKSLANYQAHAHEELTRVTEELRDEKTRELTDQKHRAEEAQHAAAEKARLHLEQVEHKAAVHVDDLQKIHTAALEKLQAELAEALKTGVENEKMITVMKEELESVRNDLVTCDRQLRQDAASHAAELKQVTSELEEKLSVQAREAEATLIRNKEELKKKMQREIDALNGRLQAGMKAFEDLRNRWEHRESRPEDVETIKTLSIKLKEAEQLARSAVEDMQFYKLELVNREENYNKTFGRVAKVGGVAPSQRLSGSSTGKARSKAPLGSQRGISPAPMERSGSVRNTSAKQQMSGRGEHNKYFGN